ncbi:2-hydroxyacid dehydrogenase [Roseateles violae]|uniref:Glyoxylate/hydroxypyruvate reductase A n=1 Tax=Roseateles violae TaxID=3058042 RepID=A0ABT8DLN3_9BURK|nr:glyoxylate/hydroxypyruvate reductase A [Pelomonas sp. PFR6]MDN3918813.1 glyoxylate/hydroxypyruvate reductase A [Pelomonas sp. PFR6]
MRVLLLGDWPDGERDRWLALLRAAAPEQDWLLVPDDGVEVAVVANPPPGSLVGLPRLRLIQSLWAGVDRLLQDASLPAGVPLARMVDPAMNEAMVQTALWAVLSLQRSFFTLQAQQRERLWRQPAQPRAAEWSVLVLGQGELGGRVAAALAALGYAARAWSRRDGAEPPLETADTVINLLPLTAATRGFFDAARLARMKRGAGLVNLARGAHVVEADLLQALDAGRLGHAVLDVFEREPLPPEHRFWNHPRVTVLPHCAAQTDPRSAATVVAANLRALREGAPLQHLVDRGRGY